MEALYREILAREVLSPSEGPSNQQRESLSRLSHDPSPASSHQHSRSLIDSFSFNTASSNNTNIIKIGSLPHETSTNSLLSRALYESSNNTSGGHSIVFSSSEAASRRFAKLEPDDLSYTNAVNPNEITRDRVRKKDFTRMNIADAMHHNNTSTDHQTNPTHDLDFNQMDHDALSTNHSSSFTMLDPDNNSLYSRFTEDDSNFGTAFADPGQTPLTDSMSTSSFKTNSSAFSSGAGGDQSHHRRDMSIDQSSTLLFRGGNGRLPVDDAEPFNTNGQDPSPPHINGVDGTSIHDTASMDTVFMGDVSSSSEVSFINWQGPLDQVRMMGGSTGGAMGGEEGAGGSLNVASMMAIDEDSIKQEDGGSLFCGVGGLNGDASNSSNAGSGGVGGGPQPGGAAGGLSLVESLSTSSATNQLIHHHLQSPSTNTSSSSSSNPRPPLASALMAGGDARTRSISSSSPRDRYSPSTTALPSELEYGECGEDIQRCSPRLKVYRESPSSPASPDRHFCSSTTSLAGDGAINTQEEDDAPRRMCLVCGDVASGFHYGVASCEACKAFFKRTIQGNIEYTCPANKDCEINKKRRKACQACRFTKCLSVGMLKEGVRLDRVRGGRQKYRRTSETPFTAPSLGGRRCLDELKILSALRSSEPESSNALPDMAGDIADLSLVGTLAEFYDRELVATIGWAKQVPGFSDIVLDDQMRLLQSTWGEILTLGLAFRSMSTGGTRLHFAADLTVDENSARECQATELFNQVLAVVERFEQVNLQHDEFLLLKAIVLTNSDVRLQDTGSLQTLRGQFLQTLLQVVENLRNHDISQHFNSLLLCLPALRSADFALRRFWLSIKNQDTVPMNKLFLEMLESQMR